MSDENHDDTERHRKVISIATRAPVIANAPTPVSEDDTPFEPHESIVQCVSDVTEMVKSGQVRALIALGWDPVGKEFVPVVAMPPDVMSMELPFMLLGGIRMLEGILANIAYGGEVAFLDDEEDE